MLTDPDKQASGNRGSAHKEDEMNREDPTQSIHIWLQPCTDNLEDLETHVPAHPCEREIFTVNLEDLEYMCSHIPLKERPQIRKATLQKWRHKNGSTVFILTSANIERDLFHERKRLVTCKQ